MTFTVFPEGDPQRCKSWRIYGTGQRWWVWDGLWPVCRRLRGQFQSLWGASRGICGAFCWSICLRRKLWVSSDRCRWIWCQPGLLHLPSKPWRDSHWLLRWQTISGQSSERRTTYEGKGAERQTLLIGQGTRFLESFQNLTLKNKIEICCSTPQPHCVSLVFCEQDSFTHYIQVSFDSHKI